MKISERFSEIKKKSILENKFHLKLCIILLFMLVFVV